MENEIAVAPKKSRRGMTKYSANPFISNINSETRFKKRYDKENKAMIIQPETGEIIGTAGFWQAQEVDSTQFIKLYVNGVRSFAELSKAGTNVFYILYLMMQQNPNKDEIILNFERIDQAQFKMSQSSFFRGIKELLEKKFIAESTVSSVYYVNPDFMWNGDRLSFVKEYRKKEKPAKQVDDLSQLKLF